MRFTISRKTWLRGEGSTDSSLLRVKDGKMCCLGSICLQGGLTPSQIAHRTAPYAVEDCIRDGGPIEATLGWLVPYTPDHQDVITPEAGPILYSVTRVGTMMKVNDVVNGESKGNLFSACAPIPEAERERLIIALAAEAGHEVEFVE